MANQALRQEIENGNFITAPGIYDLISALIADRMGFKALYVTGYGTVASFLGLPDAGLATYSQMVERIGRIAEMTKTPIIADADTGYGGLLKAGPIFLTIDGALHRIGSGALQKPVAVRSGRRQPP